MTTPESSEDDPHAALRRAVDEAHAPLRDALGRLVVAFGQCELAVAELTAAAFGAKSADARDAINAVVSFRQKLDLIAMMGVKRLQSEKEASLLQTVLKTLGEFEEQRNTLLHSKYHIKLGPETYFNPQGFSRSKQQANRKKGLIRMWEDVDVQTIRALATRIAAYTSIFEPQGPVYELYSAFAATYAE